MLLVDVAGRPGQLYDAAANDAAAAASPATTTTIATTTAAAIATTTATRGEYAPFRRFSRRLTFAKVSAVQADSVSHHRFGFANGHSYKMQLKIHRELTVRVTPPRFPLFSTNWIEFCTQHLLFTQQAQCPLKSKAPQKKRWPVMRAVSVTVMFPSQLQRIDSCCARVLIGCHVFSAADGDGRSAAANGSAVQQPRPTNGLSAGQTIRSCLSHVHVVSNLI